MSELGLHCKHLNQCANCSLGSISVEQQRLQKRQSAEALFQFPVTDVQRVGPLAFRDHFDLRVQNEVLGFMSRDKVHSFPLQDCPLGSSGLQKAFEKLRTFTFPIQKGSLRLRHSPFMEKPGLWLDFSNWDVKSLFEEGRLLRTLSDSFEIEIGQRRKALKFKNGKPHLQKEPLFRPWALTYLGPQKIPLFGQVASFTQTGAEAVKKLSQLLQSQLLSCAAENILELGAGLGTLSFPALSDGRTLTVLENDPFALEGLKHTQEWVKENLDLQLNLKIRRGDFQRVSQEKLQDSSFDTLLVNPPRSGLMKSAELISRQKNLIYVSCSAESAHRDHLILKTHYDLKELIILDQFPWTTHFELVLIYQAQ